MSRRSRVTPSCVTSWRTTLGKAGDHEGAEKAHRRGVELNPRFARGWYNLSVTLARLGKHDESLRACRRSLALQPNFAHRWRYFGRNLVTWKKDYAGAAVAFEKAIALEPRNAGHHRSLGLVRYRLGEYDAALVARRKVVELRPDSVEAWRLLGQACVATHGYADAAVAFKKAQALQPEKQTGKFLRMARVYARAQELLAAGKQPDNKQDAFAMGQLCLTLRRYKDAVRFFKLAEPTGRKLYEAVGAAARAGDPQATVWLRALLDWCRDSGDPSVPSMLAWALADENLSSLHGTDLWRELQGLAR